MYRFRFEKIEQIFEGLEGETIILPLKECAHHKEELSAYNLFVEIPSIIWEAQEEKRKEMLEGFTDAVCENVGAIQICKELGIKMHGGMHLNILNTDAVYQYAALGLSDVTYSFELPFSKMRNLRPVIPAGIISYGYLPLMKFRNCPGITEKGCSGCKKDKVLTDRKGEQFRIMCRDSMYSELLNCVPLYVADKPMPLVSFETLYFTVESKEECEKIYHMVINKEEPDFRRTAGLYNRELL